MAANRNGGMLRLIASRHDDDDDDDVPNPNLGEEEEDVGGQEWYRWKERW